MAPFFVLLPLIIYLPMFVFETFAAFRRIGKPVNKGGTYLHATWEVTHTFLILSVNYFIWLYSAAVVEVGRAVYLALLVCGAAFVVRAVLYLRIFYINPKTKLTPTTDRIFAWAHILILGCLAYIAATTLRIMLTGDYAPNDAYMPLLWPGLILTVPLVSIPLYFLYRTKR